ncbi:MAG: tyrosine-type recombinase/integrase [Crenarchaeota archaeon]|nr:tyrosine-type recombinase/integrase [Thermoproteota archaeon]
MNNRWEYEKIYHHSVEKWLERHLGKVPEKFRELFLRFVRYCRRTNVKEVTLYTYLPRLRNFLQYLHEQGIDNICEIDEDLVYDFIHELERSGKITSDGSRERYLEVIKKFLRMLYEKEICLNIKKVYDRVKLKRREDLPPYTPPELIKAIEEFILHIPDLKYKTLFAILRETGARIGEILRLKLSDVVERDYGYDIIIRKSKSKARTNYVVMYQNILRAWLSVHPGWSSSDRSRYYLIYGSRPDQPLTRSAVSNYLIKIAQRPEFADLCEIFQKYIGKPYPNPHLLRHARTFEYVEKNIPIQVILELQGWSSERMIRRYVRVTDRETRKEYLSRIVGIRVTVEEDIDKKREEKPITCPRCSHVNPPGSRYCVKCGTPLTIESVLEKVRDVEDGRKDALKRLVEFFRMLSRGEISLEEVIELLNKLYRVSRE